jgi:hypothetical protein
MMNICFVSSFLSDVFGTFLSIIYAWYFPLFRIRLIFSYRSCVWDISFCSLCHRFMYMMGVVHITQGMFPRDGWPTFLYIADDFSWINKQLEGYRDLGVISNHSHLAHSLWVRNRDVNEMR